MARVAEIEAVIKANVKDLDIAALKIEQLSRDIDNINKKEDIHIAIKVDDADPKKILKEISAIDSALRKSGLKVKLDYDLSGMEKMAKQITRNGLVPTDEIQDAEKALQSLGRTAQGIAKNHNLGFDNLKLEKIEDFEDGIKSIDAAIKEADDKLKSAKSVKSAFGEYNNFFGEGFKQAKDIITNGGESLNSVLEKVFKGTDISTFNEKIQEGLQIFQVYIDNLETLAGEWATNPISDYKGVLQDSFSNSGKIRAMLSAMERISGKNVSISEFNGRFLGAIDNDELIDISKTADDIYNRFNDISGINIDTNLAGSVTDLRKAKSELTALKSIYENVINMSGDGSMDFDAISKRISRDGKIKLEVVPYKLDKFIEQIVEALKDPVPVSLKPSEDAIKNLFGKTYDVDINPKIAEDFVLNIENAELKNIVLPETISDEEINDNYRYGYKIMENSQASKQRDTVKTLIKDILARAENELSDQQKALILGIEDAYMESKTTTPVDGKRKKTKESEVSTEDKQRDITEALGRASVQIEAFRDRNKHLLTTDIFNAESAIDEIEKINKVVNEINFKPDVKLNENIFGNILPSSEEAASALRVFNDELIKTQESIDGIEKARNISFSDSIVNPIEKALSQIQTSSKATDGLSSIFNFDANTKGVKTAVKQTYTSLSRLFENNIPKDYQETIANSFGDILNELKVPNLDEQASNLERLKAIYEQTRSLMNQGLFEGKPAILGGQTGKLVEYLNQAEELTEKIDYANKYLEYSHNQDWINATGEERISEIEIRVRPNLTAFNLQLKMIEKEPIPLKIKLDGESKQKFVEEIAELGSKFNAENETSNEEVKNNFAGIPLTANLSEISQGILEIANKKYELTFTAEDSLQVLSDSIKSIFNNIDLESPLLNATSLTPDLTKVIDGISEITGKTYELTFVADTSIKDLSESISQMFSGAKLEGYGDNIVEAISKQSTQINKNNSANVNNKSTKEFLSALDSLEAFDFRSIFGDNETPSLEEAVAKYEELMDAAAKNAEERSKLRNPYARVKSDFERKLGNILDIPPNELYDGNFYGDHEFGEGFNDFDEIYYALSRILEPRVSDADKENILSVFNEKEFSDYFKEYFSIGLKNGNFNEGLPNVNTLIANDIYEKFAELYEDLETNVDGMFSGYEPNSHFIPLTDKMIQYSAFENRRQNYEYNAGIVKKYIDYINSSNESTGNSLNGELQDVLKDETSNASDNVPINFTSNIEEIETKVNEIKSSLDSVPINFTSNIEEIETKVSKVNGYQDYSTAVSQFAEGVVTPIKTMTESVNELSIALEKMSKIANPVKEYQQAAKVAKEQEKLIEEQTKAVAPTDEDRNRLYAAALSTYGQDTKVSVAHSADINKVTLSYLNDLDGTEKVVLKLKDINDIIEDGKLTNVEKYATSIDSNVAASYKGTSKRVNDLINSIEQYKDLGFDRYINQDNLTNRYDAITKYREILNDAINAGDVNSAKEYSNLLVEEVNELYDALKNLNNLNVNKKGTFLGDATDLDSIEKRKEALVEYAEKQEGFLEVLDIGDDASVEFADINGQIKNLSLSVVEATDKFGNLQKQIRVISKDVIGSIPVETIPKRFEDMYEKLGMLFSGKAGDLNNLIDLDELESKFKKIEALYNSINSGTLETEERNESIESFKNQVQELYKIVSGNSGRTVNNKGVFLGTADNLSTLQSQKDALREYIESMKDVSKITENANGTISFKDAEGNIRTFKTSLVELNDELGKTTIQVRAVEVASSSSIFSKMSGSALQAAQQFANIYLTTFRFFGYIRRAASSAISFMTSLNSQLTTINQTMSVTSKELSNIGTESINMAKDLGSTTDTVLGALALYANANESAQSILAKASPTVMMANASGADINTVADQIQGVVNQFDDMKDKEYEVANAYEKISANLAMEFKSGISTIAEGVTAAGSLADEAGLKFQLFGSIVGKVAETTRLSGSQVGTAMKTMMARISRSQSADEDVSDEDRSNASEAFASMGISLYDKNGQFNDLESTLDALSAKWDSMTDAEKAYISEQAAGVRGLNIFRAMMDNYAESKQIAADIDMDTNFANEVQEKHLESLQAHINSLKAALQEFYNVVIDTEGMKQLVDIGTKIIGVFTNISKAFATVGSVFGDLGSQILGLIPTITLFAEVFTAGMSLKRAQGWSDFFGGLKRNSIIGQAVSAISKKLGGKEIADTLGKTVGGFTKGATKGVAEDVSESVTKGVEDAAKKSADVIAENVEDATTKGTVEGLSKGVAEQAGKSGGVFAKLTTSISTALSSGAGVIAAEVAAIAALVVGLGIVSSTFEKSKISNRAKQVKEDADAYSKTKEELDDYNQSLSENKARIDELNTKAYLTTADKTEIKNLERQNQLIQTQIDLREKKLAIEAQELSNSTREQVAGSYTMADPGYYSYHESGTYTGDKKIANVTDTKNGYMYGSAKYGQHSIVAETRQYLQDVADLNVEFSQEVQDDLDKRKENLTDWSMDLQDMLSNQQAAYDEAITTSESSRTKAQREAIENYSETLKMYNEIAKTLDSDSFWQNQLTNAVSDASVGDFVTKLIDKAHKYSTNQDFFDWASTQTGFQDLEVFAQNAGISIDELTEQIYASERSLDSWALKIEGNESRIETLSTTTLDWSSKLGAQLKTVSEAVGSASGLTAEAIEEIENLYEGLDSYDASTLFEDTISGVRVNTEALAKLNKEYDKSQIGKYNDEIKSLEEQYRKISIAIGEAKVGTAEYNDLLSQRTEIADQIQNVKLLKSEYEGLRSAYSQWTEALDTDNTGSGFDKISETLESMKELRTDGLVGTDDFKTFLKLIASDKELKKAEENWGAFETWSSKQYAEFYDNNIKAFNKYFKDQDKGTDKFLADLKKKGYAAFKNGIWSFDGDASDIAKSLGISEDAVVQMFGKLEDYGFHIDMSDSESEIHKAIKKTAKTAKKDIESANKDINKDIKDNNKKSTNQTKDNNKAAEDAIKKAAKAIKGRKDGATTREEETTSKEQKQKAEEKTYVASEKRKAEAKAKIEKEQKLAEAKAQRAKDKEAGKSVSYDYLEDDLKDIDKLKLENIDKLSDKKAYKKAKKGITEISDAMKDMEEMGDQDTDIYKNLEKEKKALERLTAAYESAKAKKSDFAAIDLSDDDSIAGLNSALDELKKNENITDLLSNFTIDGVLNTDDINSAEKDLNTISDVIKELGGSEKKPIEIGKVEGAEEANEILQAIITKKLELEEPTIMKVDKGGLDNEQASIIGDLQDIQTAADQLDRLEMTKKAGIKVDPSEIKNAESALKSAIEQYNNNPNSELKTKLGLDTNIDTETAKSEIQSKLNSIDAKVLAKIGIDDSDFKESYQTDATVSYSTDPNSPVYQWTAPSKTGKVSYGVNKDKSDANLKSYTPPQLTGKVKYVAKSDAIGQNQTTIKGRNILRGAAYAKGTPSLVGEEGAEIVVRGDEWFTVGDRGAEFFAIQDDDIVFTASQTKSLLAKGATNGRGKKKSPAFASGSGSKVGTSSSSKKSTSSSTSKSTSNKSSSKKKSSKKKSSKSKTYFDWIERKIKAVQDQLDILSAKKDNVYDSWSVRNAALSEELNYLKKQYDNQIAAADAYLKAAKNVGLSSAYVTKIQNGTLSIQGIKSQKTIDKINKYQEYWDNYKSALLEAQQIQKEIDDDLAEQFANIKQQYDDLNTALQDNNDLLEAQGDLWQYIGVAGDKANLDYLNNQIDNNRKILENLNKEYAELYDKLKEITNDDDPLNYINSTSEGYASLKSELDGVNTEIVEMASAISELTKDKFDAVADEFELRLDYVESKADLVNSLMDLAETQGYISTTKYYEALIDLSGETIEKMELEKKSLEDALTSAVLDKSIAMYSQAWYEMLNEIQSVNNEIISAKEEMADFNQELKEVSWDKFERLEDSIDNFIDELEMFFDLFESNDNIFDDNGAFTAEGLAALGTRVSIYRTYAEQVKEYSDALEALNEQYKDDPLNINYLDKRAELLQSQRDAIKNAQDEKESIKDLIEDGYDKQLDALQDLIDARKEALEDEKDAYEYQKDIAEKTREVVRYQRQLLAYSGDTSEEGRLNAQNARTNLREAQDDLRETQWDKYIEDTEKILDELYDDVEDWINKRLDNLEGILQDAIETVDTNSQNIAATITEKADEVGYSITNELDAMLTDYTVSNYQNGVTSALSTIIDLIARLKIAADNNADSNMANNNIENYVSNQGQALADKNAADAAAAAAAAASATTTSATSEPSNSTDDSTPTWDSVQAKAKSGLILSGTKLGGTTFTDAEVSVLKANKGKQVLYANGSGGYYDATISGEGNLYYNSKGTVYRYNASTGKVSVPVKYKLANYKKLANKGKVGSISAANVWKEYKEALHSRGIKGYSRGGIVGNPEALLKLNGDDQFTINTLKTGESVFDVATTKVLQTFNKQAPILQDLISAADRITTIPQIAMGAGTNIDNISLVLNLPNVKNYEEFKNSLISDKKFNNAVFDAVNTAITGKGNSLSRNKYKR